MSSIPTCEELESALIAYEKKFNREYPIYESDYVDPYEEAKVILRRIKENDPAPPPPADYWDRNY